jgi:hypothetical protein
MLNWAGVSGALQKAPPGMGGILKNLKNDMYVFTIQSSERR